MRRDKAFEKFYIDEIFKNKNSKITEREAKKIWESAQNQAVLEINEHLHDKEALKVKNTILGQEIQLLRQVYCDTKLLRKSTPSTVKDAYDSLTCSLQEVEQFDKG